MKWKEIGGPHGARTHDLIVANDALSQTELAAHGAKAGGMIIDVSSFCKVRCDSVVTYSEKGARGNLNGLGLGARKILNS